MFDIDVLKDTINITSADQVDEERLKTVSYFNFYQNEHFLFSYNYFFKIYFQVSTATGMQIFFEICIPCHSRLVLNSQSVLIGMYILLVVTESDEFQLSIN